MRNITCDICGEEIFREEDAYSLLSDFSIQQEFDTRLSEICEGCVADIRIILIKHIGSRLETKVQRQGEVEKK